jgi:hypothetical protein
MRRHVPAALAILLASAAVVIAPATPAAAQLFVSIRIDDPPPPLPIYDQPPIPGPDYVWIPGYWAWDDYVGDFYWVPGTWTLAPRPGLLWTPPWWGWDEGRYAFHPGYWGLHVGYYGGVSYGFGYTGFGYEGGYWSGPHFVYNKTVNNITNVNVTNVYVKQVTVNQTLVQNRISYSGGPGGIAARPTREQMAAEREAHVAPTPMQVQHVQLAHQTRTLFAQANHGAPPVAATARPALLRGPGVRPAASAAPWAPREAQGPGGRAVSPGGPPARPVRPPQAAERPPEYGGGPRS